MACYSLVRQWGFSVEYPWNNLRMLVLFSLECCCQHGVENGHLAAGRVGECCSELGTASTIPKSDTKECFVGMF